MYGDFGAGKTNTVLTMLLDAVLHRGARVCYAAGEGAYGVGKDRIPAHCKARGIVTRDLRGKLRIVPAVPLFARDADVTAFTEAQRDLQPNIVVLDTLATAIAGEDENGSRAAAFLTANGPAGRIRDAYRALVILPAHSGKDASKGIRGNSGFGGNADVILHLEADKDVGAIKLTVEKMRDGRDGHHAYFKFDVGVGVPVPRKITEAEYLDLVKGSDGNATPTPRMVLNQRRGVLLEHEVFSFGGGWTGRQFAEKLVGPPPAADDVDATTAWQTAVGREEKSLKNARSKKHYEGVLCDQQAAHGGTILQWRWFVVGHETF